MTMAAGRGLLVIFILNSALVVGGLVLVWLWFRWSADSSGRTDRVSEWHEETSILAGTVATAAEEARDSAEVGKQFVPLASKLKRHAREAPRGVDESVRREVFDLAIDCQQLGLEHAGRTGVERYAFLEDRLGEIRDRATALESDAGSGS